MIHGQQNVKLYYKVYCTLVPKVLNRGDTRPKQENIVLETDEVQAAISISPILYCRHLELICLSNIPQVRVVTCSEIYNILHVLWTGTLNFN
jgi:hypothetical protein